MVQKGEQNGRKERGHRTPEITPLFKGTLYARLLGPLGLTARSPLKDFFFLSPKWCIQTSIVLHRPTSADASLVPGYPHYAHKNSQRTKLLWKTSIGRRRPMHCDEVWMHQKTSVGVCLFVCLFVCILFVCLFGRSVGRSFVRSFVYLFVCLFVTYSK